MKKWTKQEIRKKKLAYKEEVAKAKTFWKDQRVNITRKSS